MHFRYNVTECKVIVQRHNSKVIRISDRGVRRQLDALTKKQLHINAFILLIPVRLSWRGYDYFMRWLRERNVLRVCCCIKVECVKFNANRELQHNWGTCKVDDTPFSKCGVTHGRMIIQFRNSLNELVHTEEL